MDYDLYRKIRIPLREKNEQNKCIETIENIERIRRSVVMQISATNNIQKQIINQIF